VADATVRHDQADAMMPNLIDCGHDHHHHDDSSRKVDAKILAVLFGGMLLIAAAFAYFLFDKVSGPDDRVSAPMQADVLAMLASILLGVPIILDAARGLYNQYRFGQSNSHMDELIALAIIASFASGQYLECGAVAFFMLISSFIEHRTAVGAQKTIESLIRITPTRAHRKNTDGSEEEVEASRLTPGDVVVIRPGENVPGDGRIINGATTINEANITGESLPVEKTVGDEVFSGTINESGRMEVQITRAAEDTTLAKVQKLILQAAQTRPVVARMLERYAAWYTPTVVMLCAVIFVFTRNLDTVISLLLIACPCAIILAGPTAIVAALSAAARLGVLIKNVTDLEVARRITAVVIDKTGTLTTGRLAVTRMQPADGVEPVKLLHACASLEKESRHPVARAVVEVAKKAKMQLADVTDFEEVAGRGVRGKIDGSEVIVGRESWLYERGINFSPLKDKTAEGLSLLFVAKDGEVLGWVGLSDTVRASARPAMDELAALGINTRVMITGDRPSPARRVAQEVNITDFEAEALPGDKLELVEALKEKGHTVAVLGDGVNDGPALAAGDISIAMGAAGSDVAIHSASIALMGENLNRIPFLVRLSRATVGVIRQNLVGVIVYILFMLTLLAFSTEERKLMTPLLAAIMHGISSILVVFNSARLIREGEELHDPHEQIKPRAPRGHVEHVDATAQPAAV